MLKFLKIREEDLGLILDWRTLPEVTRFLFTDIEHDIENQKKWFKKLSTDDSSKSWMISYEGKRIGVISLTDIDRRNKRCAWGYYIGEEGSRSLGGIIPPYLYNYVFHELKLNKILAEVMEGNDNIMKLHELHGYKFVGKHEKHVYKYDRFHDVFVYELLAAAWDPKGKYRKHVAAFEEN